MPKHYTPVDETLIPTGEIADVAGTPFDFTTAKPIGRDIGQEHEQLKFGGGYDHNWVLDNPNDGEMVFAAQVYEPTTRACAGSPDDRTGHSILLRQFSRRPV